MVGSWLVCEALWSGGREGECWGKGIDIWDLQLGTTCQEGQGEFQYGRGILIRTHIYKKKNIAINILVCQCLLSPSFLRGCWLVSKTKELWIGASTWGISENCPGNTPPPKKKTNQSRWTQEDRSYDRKSLTKLRRKCRQPSFLPPKWLCHPLVIFCFPINKNPGPILYWAFESFSSCSLPSLVSVLNILCLCFLVSHLNSIQWEDKDWNSFTRGGNIYWGAFHTCSLISLH